MHDRIRDRFKPIGSQLMNEEREQIRQMEEKYGRRESQYSSWPYPVAKREPSKIEKAFPNQGRQLFESEKPEVDEFNEKYKDALTPKPKRICPCTATVLAERKAIVEYLRGFGFQDVTQLVDNIEQGKHLEI